MRSMAALRGGGRGRTPQTHRGWLAARSTDVPLPGQSERVSRRDGCEAHGSKKTEHEGPLHGMFRGVRCALAAPIAPAALITAKRAIRRTLYKSKPTNAPRLVASAVMGQLTTSVGYCAYCLTDVAAWTVQGVQEAAGMPLGAVLLSSALLAGARFTLRSMLEEAQFDGDAGLLHIKHHSLWGPKPVDVRVTGSNRLCICRSRGTRPRSPCCRGAACRPGLRRPGRQLEGH